LGSRFKGLADQVPYCFAHYSSTTTVLATRILLTMTKRPLEMAFPDLPHDQSEMSWRDPDFPGDWYVRCGENRYCVHRIVVARGTRCSQLLRASSNGKYANDCTDVTDLLPLSASSCLENVLDYMYGKDFPKVMESLDMVHVLKAADVFQIKPLFVEMQERLNTSLEIEPCDLPPVLGEMWQSLPGSAVDGLLTLTARYAFLFVAAGALDSFAELPPAALLALLNHSELRVLHEDDVFRIAAAIDAGRGEAWTEEHRQQLWSCIHFDCLSSERKLAAASLIEKEELFPSRFVLLEMLRRGSANASRALPQMYESNLDALMAKWEGFAAKKKGFAGSLAQIRKHMQKLKDKKTAHEEIEAELQKLLHGQYKESLNMSCALICSMRLSASNRDVQALRDALFPDGFFEILDKVRDKWNMGPWRSLQLIRQAISV